MAINDQLERIIAALDKLDKDSDPSIGYGLTVGDRTLYIAQKLEKMISEGDIGGDIDPEVIAAAVAAWIEDHPEAVTTVQDGAISYAKLDSTLKGKADDVGDLKTAIDPLIPVGEGLQQVKVIKFTEGYYIPNTASTCDPTNVTANSNRKYAVVSCKAGDIFTLNCKSNSTSFCPFSIVDASNNQLYRASHSTTQENILIAIPTGGVKLIINSLIDYTGVCYHGELLPATYYAEMKRVFDPSEIINGYAAKGACLIYFNANTKHLNTLPHYAVKGSKLRIKQGTNCYFYGMCIVDAETNESIYNTRKNSFPASGVYEYTFGRNCLFCVDFKNSGETDISPSAYDATVEYIFGHSQDYKELNDTVHSYDGHANTKWRQGGYGITTGSYSDSDLWGCTAYFLDDDITHVKVPSNMRVALHLYDKNIAYIGIYNPTSGVFTKTTATNAMLTTEVDIKAAKETVEDAKHIHLSVTYAANIDGDDETETVDVDPDTLAGLVTFTRSSINGEEWKEVPPEYNAELIKTVNTAKEYQTEPCVMFLRFTDAHIYASGNNKLLDSFFKLPPVFAYLKKELPIRFIVDTGDDVNGTETDVYTDKERIDALNRAVLSTGIPFYKVPGNHDTLNNHALLYTGIYRYFTSTGLDAYRNAATNGTDYYFDDPCNKIRFVFINTTSEAANYAWPADMVTWLQNVALNTPDDYQIILFSHIDPLQDHNDTSAGYVGSTDTVNLLKAYESGNKHVMAYVYGHSHKDGLFATDWAAIATSCAKAETQTYGRVDAYWDRPTRTLGEASEQCVDLFILKPVSHKVHVVRFGAGVDRTVHYVAETVAAAGTITLTPELVAASWEAQDTAVATVSDGVVTGVAAGTTGIKAIDGNGNVEYWRVTVS